MNIFNKFLSLFSSPVKKTKISYKVSYFIIDGASMNSSSYTLSYLESESFDEIMEIYYRHFGTFCNQENTVATLEYEEGYSDLQILDDYEDYVQKNNAKSMVCVKITSPTHYRHTCWFLKDHNQYNIKMTEIIVPILVELREKGYTN